MQQNGDLMRGLSLGLWNRCAAAELFWRRDGHLIELGAFALLVAVPIALVLPLTLAFWATPDDAHPVNRLLNACQQGVTRGPFAVVGYTAGVILVGWSLVVLARLTYRSARDVNGIIRRTRMLAAESEDIECFAGGRPLAVRVLSTDAALAFTAGLLRPRIYLSPALLGELSSAELEATLLHEATHVARRDPLRCWLVELFVWSACLPRTSWLGVAHRAARESRADVAAINRLDDDRPLVQALLKVDALAPMPASCGLTSERERALRQVRTHGLVVSARDRVGPLFGLSVLAALMLLAVIGLTDWQTYWFCPDNGTMRT